MKSTLDLSGLKSHLKHMKALEIKSADVGYFSGRHSKANMSYAELAALLEYGSRSSQGGYAIPPRPALRDLASKMRASSAEFEADLSKVIMSYIENNSASTSYLMNETANHFKKRYQYNMYNWRYVGSQNKNNAPLTIALKGFNRPYEETGELIRNVQTRIN